MHVRAADGRALEVVTGGAEDGTPLLLCHGTPGSAGVAPTVERAAAECGVRVVTWSRPGYGASDRRPGRSVADAAADAAAVCDALGLDRVHVAGWSGGGPHALAVAALLGPRVAACATIAGVAPHDAEGLDWPAGMADENVAEFGAAVQGEPALRAFLEPERPGLLALTGPEVAASLGGLVDEADRAALTGELADWMAASFGRALAPGIDGWLDDDLAFVRPWGFDLASIAAPVTVWQGAQDRMVPAGHGAWLARHVPGATARFDEAHGHITLVGAGFGDVLDALLAR